VIFYFAAVSLIAIGIYTVMVKKNLIKMLLGLSIMDSGVNLLLVSIGYINGKTAPIIQPGIKPSGIVDPLPQALVLTNIVIGVSVSALALSVVIRLYRHYKTLNSDKVRDMKW
jgi:multicomponent Na+:H+ antiporter subunit C